MKVGQGIQLARLFKCVDENEHVINSDPNDDKHGDNVQHIQGASTYAVYNITCKFS